MTAPVLAAEEQLQLLERARSGDTAARERMVAANTRLVHSIVRRYLYSNQDSDDLFQVGCLGLLKAVDRFDPAFGVCFSTYAVPLIMGEIRRHIRDDKPMSVSRTLQERGTRIARKQRELQMEWGYDPEIWQLAEACGLSEEEVLTALEATRPPLSISEITGHSDKKELTLAETLADRQAEFASRLTDSIALEEQLDRLPPRLAAVIHGRYFKEQTQSELAKRMGVSQVQISRMEHQALRLLRQGMEEDGI